MNFNNPCVLTNTEFRVHYEDHIEKRQTIGQHANLKNIGYRTMWCLTIGFNGKNYIFPCKQLKIHDSHLKLSRYV